MTPQSDAKPRILLVDDDAVIAHVYGTKLKEAGYAVEVAQDGLIAMRSLNANPPELVVLDVMMPKFNGVEVLNFLRSRPELSGTKVIVLSNFYLDGADRQAVMTKADFGFVKSSCTPGKLIQAVAALLAGREPEALSPVAAVAPAAPAAMRSTPERAATNDRALPINAREDFLNNAAKTLEALNQLNRDFTGTEDPVARDLHLLEFNRKVHYVTALADQAGCLRIALLLNAFEAMLLELHEKPEHINASTLQTIAASLKLLAALFAHADKDTTASGFYARALVVDDEPLSARAASSALHRAGFKVVTLHESVVALAKLRRENFDLILMDMMMPGFDGRELCERIRALPRYQQTPIILVTGQMDFPSRAETLPSGVNDVIAKPFLPMELAVKALSHWLRAKSPAGATLADKFSLRSRRKYPKVPTAGDA